MRVQPCVGRLRSSFAWSVPAPRAPPFVRVNDKASVWSNSDRRCAPECLLPRTLEVTAGELAVRPDS